MSRVLIIEDQPAIVMILEELLTDEGYEVLKAYDGLSGFEKLKVCAAPDIVIVDLNMPGMDGRSVIKAMRSDENLKGIPVILITGSAYNSDEFPPEGSYQAVLQKPFDLTDVLKNVERLTSGR